MVKMGEYQIIKGKKNNRIIFLTIIFLLVSSGLFNITNGKVLVNSDSTNSTNYLSSLNARYLSSIDHYYGRVRDAIIHNELIYLVTECGDLLIFDLIGFKPELIGVWENDLLKPELDSSTYRASIAIRNDIAYLGIGQGGIVVLNVSNPLSPEFLAHFKDIITSEITILNNYLYVIYDDDYETCEFLIYDITSLFDPILIQNKTNEVVFNRELAQNYGLGYWINDNETILYDITCPYLIVEVVKFNKPLRSFDIKDNLLIGHYTNDSILGSYLYFYNIENIHFPYLIAEQNLTKKYLHRLTISYDFCYLIDTWDLTVVNISDVNNPCFIGEIDFQYFNKRLLNLNGISGITNTTMLSVNLYHGLQIYNFTDPLNPVVLGEYGQFYYPRKITVNNDYLFICFQNELEIYSIKEPSNPHLIYTYKTNTTIIQDLVFWGNYSFLALGREGLEILDISNITNPKKLVQFSDFTCDSGNGWNTRQLAINEEDGILFIANDWGGWVILNVTNPSNPIVLKTIEFESGAATFILYHDSRIYLGVEGSDWNLGGFYVYTVKNPLSPELYVSFKGLDFVSAMAIADGYLYLSYTSSIWGHYFVIYDLDSLSYNKYKYRDDSYAQFIYIHGKKAFLVYSYYGNSRISVLDVSKKSRPKEIDQYYGRSSTSTLWDLFIDNYTLYINEGWNGIQIYGLDYASVIGLGFKKWEMIFFTIIIPIIIHIYRRKTMPKEREKTK
jgi:hypothetical protein